MTKLPLEGIRVSDITVVYAGPFITRLLGDLGAEVIRVESCQNWQTITRGVFARPPKEYIMTQWPYTGGYPNRDPMGPTKRPWNRFPIFNVHASNKYSFTVNLRKPEGMGIFKRLIRVTDVFVENNPPETMEKLGISYEMLKAEKPDIIMVRVPAYGLTGPYQNYRGYGSHIECVAGHALLRGYADLEPTTLSHVPATDAAVGAHGAFAVLSALHYRHRTGKGQFIEIPQVENAFPFLDQAILDYTMNGRVQKTIGNRHSSAAPCGTYRCRGQDRWVMITVYNDDDWRGLCRALGNPSWSQEERFSDALERWHSQDELDKLIEEWTLRHDHFAVMHLLQKEGVACGPVEDQRDAYSDIHLKERRFFQQLTHVDCGTHLYPGMLYKLSKTPLSIRRPPVRLGEDNEYVYKKVIGVSDQEYAELEKAGHIGMDFDPSIP